MFGYLTYLDGISDNQRYLKFCFFSEYEHKLFMNAGNEEMG